MPLLTLIFTLLSIVETKKRNICWSSIYQYVSVDHSFLSLNRSCMEIICTCWCYDIVNIWMAKVLRKNRLRHYTKCSRLVFLSFFFAWYQADRYQFFFFGISLKVIENRISLDMHTLIFEPFRYVFKCYVNWYTSFCPFKIDHFHFGRSMLDDFLSFFSMSHDASQT